MVSYLKLLGASHPSGAHHRALTYETLLFSLGIPVKYFPDDLEVMKPVQYAALFSDLVKHTRFALKQLDINDPHSLQGF